MRRFTQTGSTEMERFRDDNTEGYTVTDLIELNHRYMIECMKYDTNSLNEKSLCDHIAERIQFEYDNENGK